MSGIALLDDLRRRGIELRAQGDRLLYRPRNAVPHELRAQLAEQKAEILAELDLDAAIPISETHTLVLTEAGTKVVEIRQVSPPGSTRWEKRLFRGTVALVGEVTTDRRIARTWVEALQAAESADEGPA